MLRFKKVSRHCTVVVHTASCTELLARLRAGLVVVVSQHRCSITAKELGRSKGRVAQGRQDLNTRKAGPSLALSMRPYGLFQAASAACVYQRSQGVNKTTLFAVFFIKIFVRGPWCFFHNHSDKIRAYVYLINFFHH